MTRERVTQYQEIMNTEGTNLARLEQERKQAQEGIAEGEEAMACAPASARGWASRLRRGLWSRSVRGACGLLSHSCYAKIRLV